ncbi:hypothetical protein PLANTIT3_30455 [Plantibacter sp. T3]|nr:hypothetical protein PLANTIT3_30455 [Plantibacter sp. T3]
MAPRGGRPDAGRRPRVHGAERTDRPVPGRRHPSVPIRRLTRARRARLGGRAGPRAGDLGDAASEARAGLGQSAGASGRLAAAPLPQDGPAVARGRLRPCRTPRGVAEPSEPDAGPLRPLAGAQPGRDPRPPRRDLVR